MVAKVHKDTQKTQEVFYKVNEVAEILKTTSKTVRTYIHTRKLDAHKLPNGGYRISYKDLHDFIHGLKVV